eukprot:CAMPEP_0202724176 /NCGR_PEP_ID=MMETSP1385-20130828/171480_1 /ASSEMBLY_ACC=CAM_ASM_000861 /TAXON_ID=933848 /ORGANISM="Elphidium margaritaceum" /LENGTH=607 /DNA_ID=CAMNT_0049389669 /DNA_START=118 /DNA_END=1938 /DNA_ORIENTATION=-
MAFDPQPSPPPPPPTITTTTSIYHNMSELGFPPTDYRPLFSRRHLEHQSLSDIRIALTEEERRTFNDMKTAIRDRTFFPHAVAVRCAGGWVRDKLLAIDSADIDLAIDSMTGVQFAQCLQRYFACVKHAPFKLGKIEENPSKSKHLETATFKIGALEFDAANLRTETYACDSRVPVVEIGTAQQDAMRRDLTINALFYNLSSDAGDAGDACVVVEDWTQCGLRDLVDGIARTPLDALQTYRDDPLRVLRNIRHAITKLGFRLHADIIAAAQHEQVQSDLRCKVSRERFAIEVEKMLHGDNVWIAFQCLVRLRLAPILFAMPTSMNGDGDNEMEIEMESVPSGFDARTVWPECGALAETVTRVVMAEADLTHQKKSDTDADVDEEKKCNDGNGHHRRSLWQCLDATNKSRARQLQKELLFAAFTYPFHGIRCRRRRATISMTSYFVLHSMPGLGKKLADVANAYHAGVADMIALLRRLKKKKNDDDPITHEEMSLAVGKFLLQCKQRWRLAMQLVKSVCVVCERGDEDGTITAESVDGIQQWIETKSELLECWTWKPLINGRELLHTYAAHGLAQDARIGRLLQFIAEERLKKPSTTLQELHPKIIAW